MSEERANELPDEEPPKPPFPAFRTMPFKLFTCPLCAKTVRQSGSTMGRAFGSRSRVCGPCAMKGRHA